MARCDKTSLNQQILSRRVTCELWLTGEKQPSPLWCKPCFRSSLWCSQVPPATHQLKSKASALMSKLWHFTEAELGQLWVSSFLMPALKEGENKGGRKFCSEVVERKAVGKYEIHVSGCSSCGFSSMETITVHGLF